MHYVELSLKSDSRIKFWNIRENPSFLLSGSLGRVNMAVLLKFFFLFLKFRNIRANPSLFLSGSLGRVNMGVLLKFVNYEQTYIISFKRGLLRATITEYIIWIYEHQWCSNRHRIWRLFRCNQMPSANRDSWFTPNVRIVKLATI